MAAITERQPQISAIYALVNIITGAQYVGSTKNLRARIGNHRRELEQGKHYNPRLQSDWDQFGAAFRVDVLEQITDTTKLVEREQFYVDALQPAYNRQGKVRRISDRKRSPEHVAKVRQANLGARRSDATRERLSAAQQERFRRADERSRNRIRLEQARTRLSEPEINGRRLEALRAAKRSPEQRAAFSARMRTLWADPEYRAKKSAQARDQWERRRKGA